jgi:hypothetical protein
MNAEERRRLRALRSMRFFSSHWRTPMLASKGREVWRVRNWECIDHGCRDHDEFTWGYKGGGCRRTAYSILREAMGKEFAERKAGELEEELISKLDKEGPFAVGGDEICEIVGA